jgi:catalase (peroxidase I)
MADYEDDGAAPQCPMHTPGAARSLLGRTNKDWWPEGLPVDILHRVEHRRIRWALTSTMPRRSNRSIMSR